MIDLHTFRITGGEPLMHKDTWDVFDYILAQENPNLDSSEALTYLITHSKKNQVGTTGASIANYQWFGDNGNNRYLFYNLERPVSGQSLPKTTFKNRPTSGSVYPRVRIRAKG